MYNICSAIYTTILQVIRSALLWAHSEYKFMLLHVSRTKLNYNPPKEDGSVYKIELQGISVTTMRQILDYIFSGEVIILITKYYINISLSYEKPWLLKLWFSGPENNTNICFIHLKIKHLIVDLFLWVPSLNDFQKSLSITINSIIINYNYIHLWLHIY